MKLGDYQGLAMRTSPEGHDRILNGCMGLVGECGEIVDLVKKWKFQSGDHATLPKDKLIEECGDVLWYCAELATGIQLDICEAYSKVSKYYSEMTPINRELPLEILSLYLAEMVIRVCVPFDYVRFTDGKTELSEELLAGEASEIVGIMCTIRDILEIFCGSSLEEAMERNIEKLMKRYPDGFDPERSLHRDI
mgnify:CR=1 FL=1